MSAGRSPMPHWRLRPPTSLTCHYRSWSGGRRSMRQSRRSAAELCPPRPRRADRRTVGRAVTLTDLSQSWREEGARLRNRYARLDLAALCEAHAEELEEALRSVEDELLPPTESSTESGLSKRRLRELEAEGKLENYGRKGAPLYKRGDLPRRRAKGDAGGFDAESHVAGIVGETSR